jgi:hypothetical protein
VEGRRTEPSGHEIERHRQVQSAGPGTVGVAADDVDAAAIEELPGRGRGFPTPFPYHTRCDDLHQRAAVASAVENPWLRSDGAAAFWVSEYGEMAELAQSLEQHAHEPGWGLRLELNQQVAVTECSLGQFVCGRFYRRGGADLRGEPELEWQRDCRKDIPELYQALPRI